MSQIKYDIEINAPVEREKEYTSIIQTQTIFKKRGPKT
jgi:hypothetical protein